MRSFLAFGVSAVVSAAFFPAIAPVLAESVKPQGVEKPQPAGGASRGSSLVKPAAASEADTADDAEARRLREEDERKATESKEKMKKRPGYKEEVPGPRA